MQCPQCRSQLEANAHFCGVCGYRLQPAPAPARAAAGSPAPPVASAASAGAAPQKPAGGSPQKPRSAIKPRSKVDDLYIGQTLNNRFKVESKIGEGGFGAVYRGLQLATGRKVALKLLHPEMTKDENLVARFRREGMVLCNLRDAHTITTYDFDQTPDGTLYIAMELLEGKSLHQTFHEQAPLEWKRVFKILTEMCSSLSEAHAQGIVHRDLKPENIYLESRPGNPEFVKILDFGIAKVMRGDSIDPQSPQLTATGQTLGTLEYMSPEQLMGKPLDGRSDVYALGVVAYEMITGRLPFPDAKGPAGLITAQLKQTPSPPSTANPKAGLPQAADRVILKCLEKDKNNRHADVSALAIALQEVISHVSSELPALPPGHRPSQPADLLETRRGELPQVVPPAVPPAQVQMDRASVPPPGMGGHLQHASSPALPPPPGASMQNMHGQHLPPMQPYNSMGGQQAPFAHQGSSSNGQPLPQGGPMGVGPQAVGYPMVQGGAGHPGASMAHAPMQHGHNPYAQPAPASSMKWIWWVVGLLVLGAAAGAVLAIVMK